MGGNRTTGHDDEIGDQQRLALKMASQAKADQARAQGIVPFTLSAEEARLCSQNNGAVPKTRMRVPVFIRVCHNFPRAVQV